MDGAGPKGGAFADRSRSTVAPVAAPSGASVPPAAQRLVDLIGVDQTLRLLEIHGGSRVFVPLRAKPGQRLARELSPEAEAALVEEFGGNNLEVPLCKEWRARIYRARGMTHRQIAIGLGCHERSVREWLSERADTRQTSLF